MNQSAQSRVIKPLFVSVAGAVAAVSLAMVATVSSGHSLSRVAQAQTSDTPVTTPAQPTTLVAPSTSSPAPSSETVGVQAPLPSVLTLTAIPPRLGEEGDLKVAPGEKVQTSVQVRNTSSAPITIRTTAEDFVLDEDGSTPIPVGSEVSNRWSLAAWITLAPDTQVVFPGQTATVNVLIDVPADALPGGHYAMIMHEPVPAGTQTGESASQVAQRVGTLVYFTVDGPINEEAFIRGFELPKFTEFGPVPYTFAVENTSDIHIRPRISIEIYNFLGQKVDTLTPEPKNVFPMMSRNYDGQWDRVWGMGYYRAKAVMSFGTQGKIAMASTSFWLLPYKLVLAVLTGILAVIAAIVVLRRHLLHRQQNNEAQIQALQEKVQQLEAEKLKPYE